MTQQLPRSVIAALDACFETGHAQPTSRVAKTLGISASMLRRDADVGKIVCYTKNQTPASHRVFIREDVEAYLRNRYQYSPACQSGQAKPKQPTVNPNSARHLHAELSHPDILARRANAQKRLESASKNAYANRLLSDSYNS